MSKQLDLEGQKFSENSVRKDVGVFLNNYLIQESKKAGVEDRYAGLLHELDLVKRVEKEVFKIEATERPDLPFAIVLFCILSEEGYSNTISFTDLLLAPNSIGSVFALSSNGLMQQLEKIVTAYPDHAVLTDDGGVKVLQFKEKPDRWKVLKAYYEG
jgi:hypothetical protein